ncbi:MAG: hypothetical protein HXY20_01095 [Acidobacteria bacterium]|nr:hypothetical protein [Acidobacteriota bacterium]
MRKILVCSATAIIFVALSGSQQGVQAPQVAFSAQAAAGAVSPDTVKHPDQASRKPPEPLQAVYLSFWSAATPGRIEALVEMARSRRINAVVIDLKDASGFVAFDTVVPEVAFCGARRVTIRKIDSLVQRLHGEGLYVIARIVVFEDPRLAEARPDLAVHRLSKLDPQDPRPGPATLWLDRRGLAWVDPAAREAWDYNIAIAKDAARRGFDEINFDYIRFPSDGNLQDMYFPCWDGARPRNEVIGEFFSYLRRNLSRVIISADLFGLATVKNDDLGIGQIIEDAYRHFDYVCPMVYPSHFAVGFLGERNPAKSPFRVVHYSMKSAQQKLQALPGELQNRVRLRPWLQDFDLGADYNADMVRAQIEAVREALGDQYIGFMVWNPLNRYTAEALPRVAG